MAISTPKKRPKSTFQNPNPNSSPSSSTSSTITSIISNTKPPPNLLPSISDFPLLFIVIFIASIVFTACNYFLYFFTLTPKPFCDSTLDFYDSILLSDSCEPCPSNGRCYKGQLECIQGFRKYGRLCIEDGDINETAHKFSELAKNRLCEAYAQYKCHGTGTIWVSEDDLKSMFDDGGLIQSSTVDNTKFMYIKERTMEYANKLFDVRTTVDGVKEFKCPDTLVDSYKSMSCRARQWLAEHSLYLIIICALVIGTSWLLLQVRRRWYYTNRAEQLYHQVCDILEERALASTSMSDGEPWLIASRLRDHLLLPRERKDLFLWKMVEELVGLDSRVERYPKLVKGETKEVWEWQVEGSLSSSRRKR